MIDREGKDVTSADVRRWCDQARIDGEVVDLGARAALLIAAGQLEESTRGSVAARVRAGLPFSPRSDFSELRRLHDEHELLSARLASLRVPLSAVVRHRLGEIRRQLSAWRDDIVGVRSGYSTGLRAIRRDRRDGIHLDPRQRQQLFEALARTPAAVSGTVFDRFGATVRGVTTQRWGQSARRLVRPVAATQIGAMIDRVVDAGADASTPRFADQYDTLLYLAGQSTQRIESSHSWRSEQFAVQRFQVDLTSELVQIAFDVNDLKAIHGELANLRQIAHTENARTQLRVRDEALEPVWRQLVERATGLVRIAELLERTDAYLHSVHAVDQTLRLDSRIDDLVSRSGDRELSSDNLKNVGDQIGDADALIIDYQALLHRELKELSSRQQ